MSGFWKRVVYGEFDMASDVIGVGEFGVRFEYREHLNAKLSTSPAGFGRRGSYAGNPNGCCFSSADDVVVDAVHEVVQQVARDLIADMGNEHGHDETSDGIGPRPADCDADEADERTERGDRIEP